MLLTNQNHSPIFLFPMHCKSVVKINLEYQSLVIFCYSKIIFIVCRLVGLFKPRSCPESDSMAGEDIDPNNGLILSGIYLPEEVLSLVLSNLDPKSIIKCRRVCKRWKDIADGPVWHDKALKEVPGVNRAFLRHHKLSWLDFYWICLKKPFHKNCIVNPCGQGNVITQKVAGMKLYQLSQCALFFL